MRVTGEHPLPTRLPALRHTPMLPATAPRRSSFKAPSGRAEWGRDSGPAQIVGEVAEVVVDEDGGGAALGEPDHGQCRVGGREGLPAPGGRVQGGTDQPGDEERVRDDKLVPGRALMAVDRSGEG